MINKIVYENERGLSIELNHDGPLFIFNPDGFEGIKTDVVSNRGIYQDGIDINRIVLKERLLTLNCYMLVNSEEEREYLKNSLFKTFSPKVNGKLTVYTELNYKIAENIEVIQSPVFKNDYEKTNELVQFQIQLVSPSPFFTSEEIGLEIATWTGGFSFKTSLPMKFRTKGETKKNIINNGHVNTPVKIFFNGPAVNPVVYNRTTGEFVKVKTTLLAGEILRINTEYGNKTVEIDRSGVVTNAFNLIDLDSSFFSLVPGDNLIEYTTDNPLDVQKVEVRYKERYLGV